MNQTINYIKELTAIASPTGFTREISDYLVHTLEELGYQPVRTAKGGVNVTIKGQNDEQQRYVTAHVDTVKRYLEPSSSIKLLAMSTRMQELQNVRRTIWKYVWMQK